MIVLKRLLYILILCFFASCLSKTQVLLNEKSIPADAAGPAPVALTWNYLNPTILSGELIPFALPNGVPVYVTDANGIGLFDTTTLEYTPPLNYAPTTHVINVSDSAGKLGSNNVKIAGFQPGPKILFPLSFGDQNFPTSSATTTNNDIFVSSIVADTPGWERWVVFKSSNYGSTWSQVDQYARDEEGESHPLAMATKGNDLYVCGYQFGMASIYSSEWLVRKTSNGGTNWSNVDEYHDNPGFDHVCYDIAVDAASGNIYTAGYDNDVVSSRGIIRASTDDGANWATIGTFPAVTSFYSIKVSPAGIIWAIANTGAVYQGTFALGVWNWAIVGNAVASLYGLYELRGDLEIVSENVAYYSANNNTWQISKTIDGGATWSNVFSGANMSGQDIKHLSTGELVATGFKSPSPNHFIILNSTDNGATWNQTYDNNVVTKEGVSLIEANDGSVLAFGVYNSSPYQIINLRSTDAGASWANRSEIYFKQSLYTGIRDFKKDGLGNLWSTGNTKFIDSTLRYPWVLIKSSDNGLTWQNSDVFTDPVMTYQSNGIAVGPNNEIYVSGSAVDEGSFFNDSFMLRKSTDSGATWSTVDTYSPAGKTFFGTDAYVTVASNGDVFYAATAGLPNQVEIRRGTGNGTVWSSTVTFPIEPGSTEFTLNTLDAFSDGSLWISGMEKNAAAVFQHVMYRSTDNGTTFTEVLRETGNTYKQTVKRLSNGDVYAISVNKLKKTSDNGLTWSVVYDGSATGINGYSFDSGGRLFVLRSDAIVTTQNQYSGSWFAVYNYSLVNSYYNNDVKKITDCGNATKICVIGAYEKSIDGAVFQMIPLIIP